MADRPKVSESDTQWRTAGDRIQTLLDSCAAGGAAAYERAQQLVREVVGLYGAGLDRIVQLGDPDLTERLATDDLVASLLLVHGLHPHDLRRRVSDALDRVRPYLGSHGGDVDLLEIVPVGTMGEITVRLAFTGSCKSCPSSAVTLELAVEDAVRAAAPEISAIEVVAAEPASGPAVIPAESLMAACVRMATAIERLNLASGARTGRAGARRSCGVPGRRAPRCWRAGSATSCSPTATSARRVTTRWPGRRARPGATTRAALPALPRALRRRARRGRPRTDDCHLEPTPPAASRRALSIAVALAEAMGAARMTAPYDVLARITSNRADAEPDVERCEMCSELIADEHQHVVNVAGRQLMCVCRACYLLFTDTDAQLRYRAVPDRYLAFPDFALDRRAWAALQIPVGMAFFFRNSELGRTVAFYPGPAGATESELDLDAWNAIGGADPRVDLLADDVEALLVRVPDTENAAAAKLSRPDRRLLRVRRSPAHAVARFRRRPAGPAVHRRLLCSDRGPRPGDAAMTGQVEVTYTILDVAPEPYAVSPVLTARVGVVARRGRSGARHRAALPGPHRTAATVVLRRPKQPG